MYFSDGIFPLIIPHTIHIIFYVIFIPLYSSLNQNICIYAQDEISINRNGFCMYY